jgi:DNA ligase 4
MVSKTYRPVHVLEALASRRFHFLLPDLLRFQNWFEAAVKLLQDATVGQMPTRVAKKVEGWPREIAVRGLVPQIGVMITQPAYEKSRSIKHCCQLAA